MSLATVTKGARHCRHCGREVGETLHTRSSYRVDYYAMHTGDVEPITILRPDDPEPLTVWRLLHVTEVLTCVDCYRLPHVQREREALFRPEAVTPDEAAQSGGTS